MKREAQFISLKARRRNVLKGKEHAVLRQWEKRKDYSSKRVDRCS